MVHHFINWFTSTFISALLSHYLANLNTGCAQIRKNASTMNPRHIGKSHANSGKSKRSWWRQTTALYSNDSRPAVLLFAGVSGIVVFLLSNSQLLGPWRTTEHWMTISGENNQAGLIDLSSAPELIRSHPDWISSLSHTKPKRLTEDIMFQHAKGLKTKASLLRGIGCMICFKDQLTL